MKVTSTALAFVSPHSSLSPTDLAKPENIAELTFGRVGGSADYWISSGYTQVGTAEITVELIDREQMVSNKIAALREQAASIRAKATAECTKIEGQIQQLLCLENGVPTKGS